MHIWAGSGSSSNGKETIRRRARTPQKTIRGLKKRKSSASIGSGMDGSCSNGEVGNPSLSPGPSPRKDSGIDCVMAFEAESGDSIHTYDVEEDMVKPLNVGSLDSDSGRLDTIGRIEDGLKKLRDRKLDKDLHDEVQVLSTSRKSKGRGVPLKELDHAKENGADDFSSSLSGLSRMMGSNKRIFGASRGREERQAATTIKDPDGNVLNTKSSLCTKQMISKEIPQSDTTEMIQDNPQHPTLIRGKNGPEKFFSTKEVPGYGRPNEYRCPGVAQGNLPILSTAGHSKTSSSESENDMERIFSEKHEQISEPESTDGQLSCEDSVSVIESVSDSERGDKAEGIFSVRCEDVFGPEITDEHVGDECSTPDIKSFHASEGGNESERAFSMSCEKVPEVNMDGHLRDECSTIHFKSFHNALDISQEKVHRNASIIGFSLRVPELVREARQTLFTSAHSHKTDVQSPSQESMGEITSLREIEFCASGLRNRSAGGDENSNLEPNIDDSPQIMHGRAIASVEGFPGNLGSSMSLSVMDSFVTGDVVESSVDVNVDGEVNATANDDGRISHFRGSTASSLEYPLRKFKSHSPRTENNEDSPGFKDTRQDSVERDIKNSEAFSPVHQDILTSMTPKHSIHYSLRGKPDKFRESHYGTLLKPIFWTSHEDGRNLSQEGVPTERKPSRYPGKKRAFSQPSGPCPVSRSEQNFYSSIESDCAKNFDGHGSEEWLLGSEGCSESQEEMQKFCMKNPQGVVVNNWNVREEMDLNTKGENDEDGRQGQSGGNLCRPTGMSEGRFGEAPTTICHSIPQIDGQNSPPLLAVDSLVEPTRSPSPRKRLQKVNRSKSPSSANKSSSSSLGKIFQNSRIEGMEGEIRDLRMEVGELKRMIDDLDRELKEVRVREESGCEKVEYLGNQMEEVWGTLYGKGWEDWWRDASDDLLKRKDVEFYEVGLTIPTSSKSESKSKIAMNDDGNEFENEEFMSLDTPISLEQQPSKKFAIDGYMKTTEDRIIKKLLELESHLADDRRTPDEEMGRLERGIGSPQSEIKVVGAGGMSCEDRSRKEGEGDFGKMRKEDGNESSSWRVTEDKDSREDNGDELALKKVLDSWLRINPDWNQEKV
ncbi:3076389e-f5e5-40ac-a6ec-fc33129d5a74 [Sclerotinia trifoliorum]|uniref:3076389e-f5e5-40ac-a6ec-fc33129d5a74 n=1 Tax=Sclerotinia trifoliorum TaxID=28548 RepID=A0A8H2VRQ8_9HELO|nr:3076389e-f5e5-40ac-a6ec-fc33129d5a74 [Sclerotinia trifoliorum]